MERGRNVQWKAGFRKLLRKEMTVEGRSKGDMEAWMYAESCDTSNIRWIKKFT